MTIEGPVLRAGTAVGTTGILPYRFVGIAIGAGVQDNEAVQATTGNRAIGICTGSNRDFTEQAHALIGDVVQLQQEGANMLLEMGVACSAGDPIVPGAGGVGSTTVTAGANAYCVALQDAAAPGTVGNVIIQVKWQPSVG